ncbi:hypothetical protein RB195_014494 [Necator americanus]|uniref:Uncharacterized protein n=1 Tax=Necator americanus TaxID=51031 RepID=A0ABR1E0C1_NECAM
MWYALDYVNAWLLVNVEMMRTEMSAPYGHAKQSKEATNPLSTSQNWSHNDEGSNHAKAAACRNNRNYGACRADTFRRSDAL